MMDREAGEPDSVTVWGRADSSAVARVMWTLGELGLACRRVDWGGVHGGGDDPRYRAMNPSGLIPTLRTADGFTLWESNTIIRYLTGRRDPGGLMPVEPETRARAEAWMDWSGALAAAVGGVRAAYKTPGATPASLAAAVARAEPVVRVLDKALVDRDFLIGDRLTIADLALGVWAHRWRRCPPELRRPATPWLSAWQARLDARPAYAEHVVARVSAGPQRIGG